jgi:hypothetical protein
VAAQRPYATLHLDDVDPVATTTVRWLPLRLPLGVTAFGVNAFRADAAGEELIEDHDETGAGAGRHEELYVVVSGHATFTVAGEEIDAPAGTIVFVGDPEVRRAAVARSAGTIAIAVGGHAGAVTTSPWEYSARAGALARDGDAEGAIALMREGLAHHPENGQVLYNLACFESLAGRGADALGHLAAAIEVLPESREWAATDEDFDPIREDPAFPA